MTHEQARTGSDVAVLEWAGRQIDDASFDAVEAITSCAKISPVPGVEAQRQQRRSDEEGKQEKQRHVGSFIREHPGG